MHLTLTSKMRGVIALLTGVVLLASGVDAQEVYVDNVVIVLDASGSMNSMMSGTGTRKIDAAKMAIKEVLKTIPQTTQVGLIVFGGKANGWVYPLSVRDDSKLIGAIDGLSADGGTPLGEYMKKGADRLLGARKAQYGYGSYRLLVVTDGEANDADLVDRYTPDIISRGIITDVIGVDMTKAHTLATKVHSYRSANDPAALKTAIQDVFAEVGRASDGQSGESAFEELAGFPEGVAMATISALASSGNHLIGQKPGADMAQTSSPEQSSGSGVQPQTQSTSRRGSNGIVLIIVVVGIFFIMLQGRKGRRR